MASIRYSEDIRPLSEFRANAASFVTQVQETGRPIILTQHGRSAAVLVDVAEYERLIDQVELAEDVRVAEEQVAAGRGFEHEQAKQTILARLGL